MKRGSRWKLFSGVNVIDECHEVCTAMDESNREVGIISSVSYYFF